MQDFKRLEVWQLAHRLALDVYRVCDRRFSKFPGLRAQTLRAAQSISSNIAEGSGSDGAEFARYLGMSLKSAKELENDLIFARDLDVLPIESFAELEPKLEKLRRKIIAFIRRIRGS
jgi:four helix bundle protein